MNNLYKIALGSRQLALGRVLQQETGRSFAAAASTKENKPKKRTELNYEELQHLMSEGKVSLIDVRLPCEVQSSGSIPGSVHIPLNSLKSALEMSELDWEKFYSQNKPDKYNSNLVFCAKGPNSSSAAVEIAHRLGYVGSKHYSGGWEDYCRNAGIPIKQYELLE